MAPVRPKYHTKFTPYYISTTAPRRKHPPQRVLDTINRELRAHLSAAQILRFSGGIPIWCHPTNGETRALTQRFVDCLLAKVVRRWTRVGVMSMEDLDSREIGNLRSAVDFYVEDFLNTEVLDAIAPPSAEGQAQKAGQRKGVDKPELDVVVIESDDDDDEVREVSTAGGGPSSRLLPEIIMLDD